MGDFRNEIRNVIFGKKKNVVGSTDINKNTIKKYVYMCK